MAGQHLLIRLAYALDGSRWYRRLRQGAYDLLENPESSRRQGFDLFMMALVISSVGLLVYDSHEQVELGYWGRMFENFTVGVFILEYLGRFWLAGSLHETLIRDYEQAEELGQRWRPWRSFGKVLRAKWNYVTSPLAIIDLLAIVPAWRPLRFLRIFLLLRLFKLFRYARSINQFARVFVEKRIEFYTLGVFLAFVIFAAGSGIYYFEVNVPHSQIKSFFDSFYWAIITISTVGYGDITPVTTEGRVISILLILAGIGTISFFTSLVVSSLSERVQEVRKNRVFAEASRMRGHTVVCGFGRVGQTVCESLARDGEPFVVVEQSENSFQQAHALGYHAVLGDATSDNLLKQLGVGRNAARILCLTEDDVTNLYITLTARQLDEKLQIISRVKHHRNQNKFRRAGADFTVMPYRLVARMAAEFAGKPVAFEAVSRMLSGTDLVQVDLVILPEDWPGQMAVEQLPIANNRLILLGVMVDEVPPGVQACYPIGSRHFLFNPETSYRPRAGEGLVLVGHLFSLQHFKEWVEEQ